MSETAKKGGAAKDFLVKYSPVIILIALVVVSSIISPVFLSVQNIFNVLRQQAPYIFVALGVLMTILTGGIDLSAGFIISVSHVFLVAAAAWWGFSSGGGIVVAILLCLGVGIGFGMINGFLGANAGSAYNQFRDIIDYYLPINFAVDANRIVVSNVLWNSLTDEQRASFTEHAKEIFLASIEKTKEETQDYYNKLTEAGVNVVELTQEDYDTLAGIAREKCWPTIIETYGQDVYDAMMEFYQK